MAVTRIRKGKAADKRPARDNYWKRGTLKKNKVRNLVRCAKMDPAVAAEFWENARQGRRR